jgi:nitric oxide reductase subunit B
MSYRKLWIALSLVLAISFAVLSGFGIKLLKSAPPIPARVVASDGRVLFEGNAIRDGQNAWQERRLALRNVHAPMTLPEQMPA